MSDRGRGQSRGRARGFDPRAQQAQPGVQAQQQPPPQGAWGRRSAAIHPAAQAPYVRPAAPQQRAGEDRLSGLVKSVSRGTQRIEGGGAGPSRAPQAVPMEQEEIGERVGGGGDAVAAGRGAMRGRRTLTADILNTKPQHITSKKGTSGRRINLTANYFKLLTTTDWCLYQYRVDFAPDEDRTVVRKGLLRLHKDTLGAYIFDGTVLYTSHRLQDPLELFSTRTSDEQHIRITIKFVGDMVKGDYHYLQFFNIIMRKCLEHLHLQLVGRNYFDARNRMEVREYRLELWPGYVTSIRQHENDILLCAEITHKVMRQQTLFDILSDCYHKYGPQEFKKRFAAEVVGVVVLTDYNNNTYRIDDVDFDASPSSTFERRDGPVTYAEYYRSRYDIRIQNASQPMLVSRSKPRDRRAGRAELVYLVPELCRATGLTDEMRNQFQLMRAVDGHTRLNPEMRQRRLLTFNERLRGEQNVMTDLTSWNLSLDRKLLEVPARVLNAEKILFGGRVEIVPEKADWTREQQSQAMILSAALKDWVLLCTNRCRRDAENFIRLMVRVSSGLRFPMKEPQIIDLRDDRPGTFTNTLENIMSSSTPEMVFCVVPNNSQDRYSAIKKKCCVDRPVPSQVLLQKNLSSKNSMTIATKVVIQMNCKLGGAAWAVQIPVNGLMVVGFDVCHDTNMKSRDFGAMVASLDRNITRYYSAVSTHTSGEELSNDLAVNLCKALQKYRQINNALPERIVIYRDGVGEGQVPYVVEHEVKHIKEKLVQLYGSPEAVRMAFVLVTKRINTRLFKGKYNPDAGTVVDDVITNPVKYDFFIVSQNVRQGTVSPTSYSVLEDTLNWSPDNIQRLTYKMTHLYYNLSATIRVPAPCHYAHKLAFLVGQHIHRPPSTQLESLLYYI